MKTELYRVETTFLGAHAPSKFYFDEPEKAENFVENETHKFIWWRIEVEEYQYHWKSYWVTTDQIIRIQDEPDEVPYYSGW